jgi:hypothetical protein
LVDAEVDRVLDKVVFEVLDGIVPIYSSVLSE